MPLDATGLDLTLDPLEKIGIRPISEAVVTAYKADYRAKFLAADPKGPGPFEWRTFSYSSTPLWSHFLVVPWEGVVVQVPEAVVDLAHRVEREVEGAEFSVDYFYRDPVLHISYRWRGEMRKAYLAIWDNGVVQAIAE